MAHDVFVSYSQEDKPVADAVVARLEQDGLRCWVAPRDIIPGSSWGEAIVEAIDAARVMVLVLSANSNGSRQVVREVERAVASDVIILPFRIENIDPTGAMAYFLGTEHWLDALTPPLERHIGRLSQTVRILLEGRTLAPEDIDVPPPSVGRPGRRSWVPVIAVSAVVLIAGIGLALFLLAGDGDSSEEADPTTSTSSTSTPTSTSSSTSAPPPVTTSAVAIEQIGSYQPIDLDLTDARTPDAITDLDVEGSTLAFSQGIDGVTLVAIGDPSTPRPMTTFGVPGATAVAFDGEWVYALAEEAGATVRIFDGDGFGPAPLDLDLDAAQSIYHAEYAGSFLYLSGHDLVAIVDVTDPTQPEIVHEWSPSGSTGNPADTFVTDGTGYFAAGWDGLYVFDVSDPSSPVALGHWPSPDWILDLEVVDDVAVVTLGDTGLATVDVSDPTQPKMLGLVELPGFASPLAVGHGHAFVAWYGDSGSLGGIAVVDVRDPEEPVFLDTYGRFQSIEALQLSDTALYLADIAEGLVVFEVTGLD